ncbi:MAG: hypothetical protein WDZ35_16115 [Crocinitomicaceae bacterium]
MQVTLKNIKNEKIIAIFKEVLEEFESLHNCEIVLGRKRLRSSTMQAQPDIRLWDIFSTTNRYKVNLGYHIKDKEELIIANVPDEVLKGWFAHELGHLVDYRQHSNLKMLAFGFKYVFSSSFRMKAEHDADYIAIKYGFFEEILATKDYILDHDLIEDEYKAKIKKYYLSRKKVVMCSKDKSLLERFMHL